MLQITTKDLKNRKRVLIDNHEYVVRKLGAGEELQMSQAVREINKIAAKEKSGKELTKAEIDRGMELGELLFTIYEATFDDGEDGSKSRKLLRSLSQDDIKEMQEKIFGDGTSEETASTEATA